MRWEYDGSFEGFLCCVAKSYRDRALPDTLRDGAPPGLFDAPQWVETDAMTAKKVLEGIRDKLGHEHARCIFHAHLCDDSAPERDLLLYLRLGFKDVRHLQDLANPVVYAVEQYQKRVLSTLHKMHAFTRFEELSDGLLYARIAPPRNMLPILGTHFKKRFGTERFIIHDVKRATALTYESGTLRLHSVHDYDIPERSADEARFQDLWKRFFDTVAIDARLNSDLQRQHVPLKYREYMTEFGDDTAGAKRKWLIDKS